MKKGRDDKGGKAMTTVLPAAGFAIGTWDEVRTAIDGLPAIRVHLFKREAASIDSFAGEMWRVWPPTRSCPTSPGAA